MIMGLPPPKCQDLKKWTIGSSIKGHEKNEVWEIGVPKKNSLVWSIGLSYLFLAKKETFSDFLQKLTGNNEEEEEITRKRKLRSSKADEMKLVKADDVKKRLKRFNPFKNRHTFFIQAKEVIEVIRIFDLRLERYAYSLKRRTDQWSDDFKLNAASLLLDCEIVVYFPNDEENTKFITYPKESRDFKSQIILFQYENQECGSRKENINEFHFSMTTNEAYPLKLDALVHILKKTNVSNTEIAKVRQVMSKRENHGKNFLTAIFKNKLSDVVLKIYKSPYIALKLSEAGFETNPIAMNSNKPSPLCHAVLFTTDPKCIGILYDYACNCRGLFDISVRRVDETILTTLTQIKQILKEDVSLISRYDSDTNSNEQASSILKQYISFNEFQFEIASEIKALEDNRTESTSEFQYRKEVIKIILTQYISSISRKSEDFSGMLIDYFQYSEYYKNIDNFCYLSFFDHIYKLKISTDEKTFTKEDVHLKIEWSMILAMLSNKYFSKPFCEMKRYAKEDQKKWEKDFVLQYIPLLHRNAVKTEMSIFLKALSSASKPEDLKHFLLSNNRHALPQVTDELLIVRLMMHIEAVLEISPDDDGIKAIHVIERTLQVLGESIKLPTSNSSSSIRYLLRSLLPDSLRDTLINIRNVISHYEPNSALGRLEAEKKKDLFDILKDLLKEIGELFQPVLFTQYLRIEETLMVSFRKEFGNKLEKDVEEEFSEKCAARIKERETHYFHYDIRFQQLLWQSVSDLQKSMEDEKRKNVILGWLKTIEYLAGFILRHKEETNLEILLLGIQQILIDNENKELDDIKKDILVLLPQYTDAFKNAAPIHERGSDRSTAIEKFWSCMKKSIFEKDEEEYITAAIKKAYEEAEHARNKLKNMFSSGIFLPNEELEKYLKKLLIPKNKIQYIRDAFGTKVKNGEKYFREANISKESLQGDIQKMLENSLELSPYYILLLTKITFKTDPISKIFNSIQLSKDILAKLEAFLAKKVLFLINRLKALKSILIDEDEEIKATFNWGKSEAIQHHMKFLMRQRYTREMAVHASLEMLFFDCANILNKTGWKGLYEKSIDLFAGISLRNLAAHCTNIEAFSEMLDEDDFPTEMIEKILMLINDIEAIESIHKLFPILGHLTEESFKEEIEKNELEEYQKDIEKIKRCKGWENYLFVFPFLKT